MSNTADIITQIKAVLEANAALTAAGVKVLLGPRERILSFPVICINPAEEAESEETYPLQEMTCRVILVGAVQLYDDDHQVVGDVTNKGIVDLLNDVKNALDANRMLNGRAVHLTYGTALFEIDNPAFTFTLPVVVQYQLTRGVRT
jgi:hypothetical protein